MLFNTIQYAGRQYDYCTNVQFENSLRHSVKEIMKTQSPKLIVIDVAPFIQQHSAGQFPEGEDRELVIKYNIDSMSYSLNRIQLIHELNQESNGDMYSFLYYVFDICRYHTNKPSWEKHDNAYSDVTRGYGYLRRNGSSKLDTVTFFYDDGNEKSLEGCHQVYFVLLGAEKITKYLSQQRNGNVLNVKTPTMRVGRLCYKCSCFFM